MDIWIPSLSGLVGVIVGGLISSTAQKAMTFGKLNLDQLNAYNSYVDRITANIEEQIIVYTLVVTSLESQIVASNGHSRLVIEEDKATRVDVATVEWRNIFARRYSLTGRYLFDALVTFDISRSNFIKALNGRKLNKLRSLADALDSDRKRVLYACRIGTLQHTIALVNTTLSWPERRKQRKILLAEIENLSEQLEAVN